MGLMAAGFAAMAWVAPPATWAQTAPVEVTDFAIGPADAKVQMIEYASFTCPHCASFHANVFKPLKADYIDTGKVLIEYHEVYFDQMGLLGAMLAGACLRVSRRYCHREGDPQSDDKCQNSIPSA
jgi:protein-disulfide isomerase